jgi:hypothetical protein
MSDWGDRAGWGVCAGFEVAAGAGLGRGDVGMEVAAGAGVVRGDVDGEVAAGAGVGSLDAGVAVQAASSRPDMHTIQETQETWRIVFSRRKFGLACWRASSSSPLERRLERATPDGQTCNQGQHHQRAGDHVHPVNAGRRSGGSPRPDRPLRAGGPRGAQGPLWAQGPLRIKRPLRAQATRIWPDRRLRANRLSRCQAATGDPCPQDEADQDEQECQRIQSTFHSILPRAGIRP